MALGISRATPATTLAWVGACRTTTLSTVTMIQVEAPQVGAITVELVVDTTQSTDSSSIPRVASKQQMTSHTIRDTGTIAVCGSFCCNQHTQFHKLSTHRADVGE